MRRRVLQKRLLSGKFFLGFIVFTLTVSVIAGVKAWNVKLRPNSCLSMDDLRGLQWKPRWIWDGFGMTTDLRRFPCVDKLTAKAQFPGVVVLEVIQRQGLLGISELVKEETEATQSANQESSGQYYLVDSKGYVFSKTEARQDLPFIWVKRPIALGDKFESLGKLNWKEVILAIQKNWGTYLGITYREPADIELQLEDISVLLPANQSIFERIEIAKDVYINAKREGRKLSRIDYRFEKLVISY